MSFRFVGTALTILSTSTASGLYIAHGMPASSPHGPTVVVPVVQAQALTNAAAHPPITAVVNARDVWRPRIWVGTGATLNPVTGEPLTREEQESGWVDGPNTFARDIVRTASDPVTHAAKMVKEPNPEVLVLKPGEKAPAWVRGTEVALAPGVEIEAAPPPQPPMMMHQPSAAPAPAPATGGYRIHLESYRDDHLIPRAWAALQKANPAVLGGLQASTTTVTVAGKGKFIRLLAGPFAAKGEAEKACAAIKKAHHNQYCHLVAPGRESR